MIASVITKGSYVLVYDIKNKEIGRISLGSSGYFYGCTTTTLDIRKGNTLYTYDEGGKQISQKTCRQ